MTLTKRPRKTPGSPGTVPEAKAADPGTPIPIGVWWGLRAGADGGSGFPVPVIGGDRADVALPAEAGAALAALLVARRQSAVVDTSGFTMGERRRFYGAFLAGLNHENRAALHLVVDEADELAPQRPLPDQTTVLHEMDRIMRRGRARGFRVLMITQRPAVLHKDVLSQAGCLIAMQLTAAQDRAAIGAWIEGQADRAEAKALLASLPQLRTGEGWLWWPHAGPPVQQRFPRIRTLDTGSTPAHGEEARRHTALGRRPRPRGAARGVGCAGRRQAPPGRRQGADGAARRARSAGARARPGDRRARGLPGRHPRGGWRPRAPRRRDRHFARPSIGGGGVPSARDRGPRPAREGSVGRPPRPRRGRRAAHPPGAGGIWSTYVSRLRTSG